MNAFDALAILPTLADDLDAADLNGNWAAYDGLVTACNRAIATLTGIYVTANMVDALFTGGYALSTVARMVVSLHNIAADAI